MANPLECILQAVDAITCENRIKKVQAAIKTLQPQQQELIRKKFYDNRTNVDIAAEEGVTEAAIRNRLKKIYSNLSKKLQK
jgi:RNA polymerase sigma factor (sigma-70 family)